MHKGAPPLPPSPEARCRHAGTPRTQTGPLWVSAWKRSRKSLARPLSPQRREWGCAGWDDGHPVLAHLAGSLSGGLKLDCSFFQMQKSFSHVVSLGFLDTRLPQDICTFYSLFLESSSSRGLKTKSLTPLCSTQKSGRLILHLNSRLPPFTRSTAPSPALCFSHQVSLCHTQYILFTGPNHCFALP